MKLVLENVYTSDVYYTIMVDEDHKPNDPWYLCSFQEVDKWCTTTYGEQDVWGVKPVTGWKRMRNKYFFTDQNKRDFFILRWS